MFYFKFLGITDHTLTMIDQDRAILCAYEDKCWLLTLSSEALDIVWTPWRNLIPSSQKYFTSNYYPRISELIVIGGVLTERLNEHPDKCIRILVQPRSLTEASMRTVLQNYDRVKPILTKIPATLQKLVDMRLAHSRGS